eukprot:Sspe_Gene.35858::Locus_17363_Transcript_1_1_Confidence_1.000_Length_997::g.35858::m.35858
MVAPPLQVMGYSTEVRDVWAHGVCNKAKLQKALSDPTVTAIEGDVYLSPTKKIPVMAHPPRKESDLTFFEFLEALAADGKRGVKLDFKDFRVIESCLRALAEIKDKLSENGQRVWLNADILPGPNTLSSDPPKVAADSFISMVTQYFPEGILSLGWWCVVGHCGYTEQHADAMLSVVDRYPDKRYVFTASARLALLDPTPLRRLLEARSDCELLMWTGTGEPAIDAAELQQLRHHFAEYLDRVNFDVKTPSSFTDWAYVWAFRVAYPTLKRLSDGLGLPLGSWPCSRLVS